MRGNNSRIGPLAVMCLIDLCAKIGGAERHLHLLARGLRECGHKVIICCLQGGEALAVLEQEGFLSHNLNVQRIYDLRGLRGFRRLIEIIRQEGISVIVSYHESSDFLGLAAGLVTRIPVISSRRDMGYKLKRRHIWVYRLINRMFSQITTVSSAVKNVVAKKQWTKPSDIVVIPNGVSLPPQGEAVQDLGNTAEVQRKDLKIVCIANIRRIKGQKTLIEALGMVVAEFPDVGLFLVGSHAADEAYFLEVQRVVKNLKLEKFVRYVGEIDVSSVPQFVSSMDISVSASLSEGMSNAILESMAAGRPVVATAVGGNCELVVDGDTGYLVPAGDARSLADALVRLLKSRELRIEMGQRGMARVRSDFSVKRMVEKYEDLIQYVYWQKKLGNSEWRVWTENCISKFRLWGKFVASVAAYYSGLIFLWGWAKKALRLGRVKILCFHDISEITEFRRHLSISIQPDLFRKFIDFLTKNYRVVSLQEATSMLEAGRPLTEDVFALTFDDGYSGWLKCVLPECGRTSAPCAFFVSTEPLDTGLPLFYDGLIFLVEGTWRKVLDLSPWQLGVFVLNGVESRVKLIEVLHKRWRGRTNGQRRELLRELSEYLGALLNSDVVKDFVLSWDDVRKLDSYPAEIGSHSVSHGHLSELSGEECLWEIRESKKRLEEELGHRLKYFAYPYGMIDDDRPDIIRSIAEAKFRNAFTLTPQDGDRFQPYRIERRSISRGMFLGLSGKFSKSVAAVELCGLGDVIFFRLFNRGKRHFVNCGAVQGTEG